MDAITNLCLNSNGNMRVSQSTAVFFCFFSISRRTKYLNWNGLRLNFGRTKRNDTEPWRVLKDLMSSRSPIPCFYNQLWQDPVLARWRHQMETFFALLAFVRGIHRSPVNSPQQRPVTRSFDVFFDRRLKNGLVNNREAGDLRRHRTHYDVAVMVWH